MAETYDFKTRLTVPSKLCAVLDDCNEACNMVQTDEFFKDVAYAISENDREPLEVVETLLMEKAAPLDKARSFFQPKAPPIAPWLGMRFLRRCRELALDCVAACDNDPLLDGVRSVVERSDAFGDITTLLGRLEEPLLSFEASDLSRRFFCYTYQDMVCVMQPILYFQAFNAACNMISSDMPRTALPTTDWDLNSAFFVIQCGGVISRVKNALNEEGCKYLFSIAERMCRIYKQQPRVTPFQRNDKLVQERRKINQFLLNMAEAATRHEATLSECMTAQMKSDALDIMEQIAHRAEYATELLKTAIRERRAEEIPCATPTL